MLIIAQVLKEKWLKITGFAHSQTTNKLVNEAANDSARVSGQDRKKPPALWTNQIAEFGGFRPLASLKKINSCIAKIIWTYQEATKVVDSENWRIQGNLHMYINYGTQCKGQMLSTVFHDHFFKISNAIPIDHKKELKINWNKIFLL